MSGHSAEHDQGLLVTTCRLAGALWGIDALRVQEIIRAGRLTPVHHARPEIAGLINLRGRLVTIIDLHCALGFGPIDRRAANRIVIVDWEGEHVGLLVDAVADVLSANQQQLEDVPSSVDPVRRALLRGVLQEADGVIAFLDVDAVLDGLVSERVAE